MNLIEPASPSEGAWQAFEAQLRTYVRRRVDPAVADDVVGDILLRLVQHREALGAAGNPAAWVQRVATNAVADHHRRRATERRALTSLAREAGGGVTPSAETEASTSPDTTLTDLARCLVPMIRGLPAPYAEALLLTDIEGLTQGEAAARLGLSASGMKSRVQRGRAKLKQALLGCCAVELDRRGGVVAYRKRGKGCGSACGGGA